MNQETLKYYLCWLQEYFVDQGMNPDWAIFLNTIINCVALGLVVFLVDVFVRKFIVQLFKAFSDKTKTTYDDFLVKSNFPRFVAHFFPVIIIAATLPIIFVEYPLFGSFLLRLVDVYIIVLCVLVFRSVLKTTRGYLEHKPRFHDKPLQSYQQVMMIFGWGVGIFLIINILTGYSIFSLTTLGAASAILLLIFKDTILGFVASIQVSVNDIVRIGDWITFSKYGADGTVTEISLATVTVQNFDNTFTTIPTYSLISDSFQNWRGMQESGGRRIKRALFIEQASVKLVTDEELEQLKKIQLIKPYIEHRQRDVEKYNQRTEADKTVLLNGRNQTNLGIFRKYVDAYLHENPAINKELFLMVRHLAPTDRGIPIEVYCFSSDKRWENYEHIQADIFDHIIAAVPYFGLELHEIPSGNDITGLLKHKPSIVN
ncbi:mechanosensitive ion channel family protein [Marixanthomonas spongiae]|uniref:Mechanosensitive ion channel protein MscS n=1 Tax=Marixanthomonas spongiae TaxID=2174845 RepID=A0A2U0I3U5_9FLAO|nr:mechanosensitive ion channel domain-containing protein [Marixanthomonas spongiae]PVW15660.1 mechanosensitive ion channel protein MscS [Marixanthomonas spongiae]